MLPARSSRFDTRSLRALTVTPEHRLQVSEVPDPEAGPGGVVVRVSACGICGSDLHLMESRVVPPGAILGHEAAGVVEDVGPDVQGLRPGDAVAIHPFDPCGECQPCRTGAQQRCLQNAFTTIGLGMRPGAYAELITLSPGMLVPVPSSSLDAIAVAEPLAVALHGLRRSRFEPGMSVGVVGCGPIGLCAVLAARASGAERVWACDVNDFRAALAEKLGADESGRAPKEADIVVECAGAQGTVDLAVSATRGGGQVVVLAVNVKGDTVYPFTWVAKEVDIAPCLGYTKAEYEEAAGWIASGRVDVEPMITRRVSLDETDAAFFALLGGAREGKVLVVP